jgi:hypothetical protein
VSKPQQHREAGWSTTLTRLGPRRRVAMSRSVPQDGPASIPDPFAFHEHSGLDHDPAGYGRGRYRCVPQATGETYFFFGSAFAVHACVVEALIVVPSL